MVTLHRGEVADPGRLVRRATGGADEQVAVLVGQVQQRMDELSSALPAAVVQKEQLDVLEVPAHRLLNVPGVGPELGDDLIVDVAHS